jgi:hypothetical protein
MSDHERLMARVGKILDQVARPHRCDDALPVEVHASLWQIGMPCDELTTREELIARLWACKRTLMTLTQPGWGGGPGLTPPTAA